MSRRSVTVYLYPEQSPLPRIDRLRDAAARFTGRDTALWTRAQYEGGKPYFPEAPELFLLVFSGVGASEESGKGFGYKLHPAFRLVTDQNGKVKNPVFLLNELSLLIPNFF